MRVELDKWLVSRLRGVIRGVEEKDGGGQVSSRTARAYRKRELYLPHL